MDSWASLPVHDGYQKLVIRMNPPRVSIDNNSSRKATLIKVDSSNRHGSLLEVVQVLADLNLIIRRGYISSDGEWFMDGTQNYAVRFQASRAVLPLRQDGTRRLHVWALQD